MQILILNIILLFVDTITIPSQNIGIYDGDTFYTDIFFISNMPVRIRGIDTPEKSHNSRCKEEHKLAVAAQDHLHTLLHQQHLTLTNLSLDKYKRLLATVTIHDRDIAIDMIASNHARLYHGGKRRSWCTQLQDKMSGGDI